MKFNLFTVLAFMINASIALTLTKTTTKKITKTIPESSSGSSTRSVTSKTVPSKIVSSSSSLSTTKQSYNVFVVTDNLSQTRVMTLPDNVANAYVTCYPPKGFVNKRSYDNHFSFYSSEGIMTNCITFTQQYPTTVTKSFSTTYETYSAIVTGNTYPAMYKSKSHTVVMGHTIYTSRTLYTYFTTSYVLNSRYETANFDKMRISCSSKTIYNTKIPYVITETLDTPITGTGLNQDLITFTTVRGTRTITDSTYGFVPITYFSNLKFSTLYSEDYQTITNCDLYNKETETITPSPTVDVTSEITEIPITSIPTDTPTPFSIDSSTTTTTTKIPPTTTTTTTTKIPPTTTTTTTTKIPPTTTTTTTTKIPPTTTKCLPVTLTVTKKEKITVTEKETITVTVTENDQSTPTNISCAKKWAQCGGINYSGPTCCESGSTCNEVNKYYSQCI